MDALTWIDWLLLIVIAASTLLGLLRGFLREVAGLGIWIVAFVGASRLSPYASEAIAGFASPAIETILAFLIVFVLIVLLGKLISNALQELLEKSGGSSIDSLLGAAFGGARGVLIGVGLGVLASLTSLPASAAWQGAALRAPLEMGIDWVQPYLPGSFQRTSRLLPLPGASGG